MSGLDIFCLIFSLLAFGILGFVWGEYSGSRFATNFLRSRMCANCINQLKEEAEERHNS
jgi:hypothetical protein